MQCVVHSVRTRKRTAQVPNNIVLPCPRTLIDSVWSVFGVAQQNPTHTRWINLLNENLSQIYSAILGCSDLKTELMFVLQTSVRTTIQIQSDLVMDGWRAWPRALVTAHITPHVIMLCTFYTSTIDIACIRDAHTYYVHLTVHAAVFQPKGTSEWGDNLFKWWMNRIVHFSSFNNAKDATPFCHWFNVQRNHGERQLHHSAWEAFSYASQFDKTTGRHNWWTHASARLK